MDTFDKWFSRFLYATEVILLLASMPHIAAWFAHFDNPTDMWSGIYAWSIGFGLAFAIDGVAFMLLLAIMRMIRSGKTKSTGTMIGLIAFTLFIALLSWGINWQYNLEFSSNAFAKADAVNVFGWTTVGRLNPIIGGAFQVLILAYALIGKAMQTEVKSAVALSDEAQAQRLKKARQDQEYKAALKGDGLTGKVDDAIGFLSHVGKRLKGKSLTDNAEVEEDVIDEERESQDEVMQESTSEERESQETGQMQIDLEVMRVIRQYPAIGSWLSTSKKSASIDEIVIATNKRKSTVQNALDKKQLIRSKNPELIRVSSIVNWLKTQPIRAKSNGDKEPITGEHEAIRLDS